MLWSWEDRYISRCILMVIRKGLSRLHHRTQSRRMKQLIDKTSFKNNLTPVLVDYRNTKDLQTEINVAIKKNGPNHLVVASIHSDAPDGFKIIIHAVQAQREQRELFHILGSSTGMNEIKKGSSSPRMFI